jgi:hypothetical protein
LKYIEPSVPHNASEDLSTLFEMLLFGNYRNTLRSQDGGDADLFQKIHSTSAKDFAELFNS